MYKVSKNNTKKQLSCVIISNIISQECYHCQVVFMKTNILILQKSDKALKKHYIISNKTSMNSGENTYKK